MERKTDSEEGLYVRRRISPPFYAGIREGFAPCSRKGGRGAQNSGGRTRRLRPRDSRKEREGGAKRPWAYSKASPHPCPLFVHFVDFCEFGVGDGGGTIEILL